MKKRLSNLRNNSGSTLTIVIISIAIVSILAALLISMSSLSAKLKYWDRQLKQTMYYSEAGLDQIYANLTIEIERTLEKAFNQTKAYVESEAFSAGEGDVQAVVNDYFKKQFVSELRENNYFYKGLPFRVLYDSDEMVAILNSFISNDVSKYGGLEIPKVISIDDIDAPTSYQNYKYTIKGIKVEYTNPNTKLRTAIHTDIVIEAPDFDYPLLIQESIMTEIPISEYAIIAKENINVNRDTVIKGSVYAGGAGLVPPDSDDDIHNNKGINVTNTANLDISGPMVITPSDITINNGTITIKSSEIFANGIATTGASVENVVKILGDDTQTFVYDDLELNANKSRVYVEGKYYGISIGNFRHNSSSSIVVNGPGSILDLSKARSVYLAGLSYFDLNPSGITPSTFDTMENGDYIRYYRTGESISVRGNHVAYFMPHAYSLNDELTAGYNNFFSSKVGTTIEPEYYSGGTVTMLKIPKDKRPDYFYDYFQYMNDYMLQPLDFTGIGASEEDKIKIKLNPSFLTKKEELKTQGVAVATEINGVTANKVVEKSGINFNDIDNLIYNRKYTWALGTGKPLSDSEALGGISLTSDNIIDLYLQPQAIQLWNKAYNKAAGEYVSFVSNDDVIVSTTGITDTHGSSVDYKAKGIIISGGNVIINEGVHFEGLIIAGRSIIVNGNASITASRHAISETLAINHRFKTLIFKGVETSPDSEKIYWGSTQTNMMSRYGELVKFQNWSKNKE